jgi:GGDEF domain-containing protein
LSPLHGRCGARSVTIDRGSGYVGWPLCDANGFKAVSDEHGHDVGDASLVAAAHRLCSALRNADTLTRVTGDEFVILGAPAKERGDPSDLMQRPCVEVGRPFDITGNGSRWPRRGPRRDNGGRCRRSFSTRRPAT